MGEPHLQWPGRKGHRGMLAGGEQRHTLVTVALKADASTRSPVGSFPPAPRLPPPSLLLEGATNPLPEGTATQNPLPRSPHALSHLFLSLCSHVPVTMNPVNSTGQAESSASAFEVQTTIPPKLFNFWCLYFLTRKAELNNSIEYLRPL